MAIVGLGIDAVEIFRFREILERHGERFTDRVFTEGEVRSLRRRPDPVPGLAARFAAKEAGIKALQATRPLSLRNVEVVGGDGKPVSLEFHGVASERMRALGGARVWVSLSHTAATAVAVVAIESG